MIIYCHAHNVQRTFPEPLFHYPVDKKGNITWPENVQEMR